MAKTLHEKKESVKRPSLKVSLFESLWTDPGRRALFIILIILFCAILVVLAVNLINALYIRNYEISIFYGLERVQANSNRIFVPTGLLLVLISLSVFALSETYGGYTELSVGKKTIHAKSFFKRLSFYMGLLGGAFLLSGGIVESISTYF